jgi:glycosyltransferase involved in cell wall biosynthesis
MGPDCTPDTIGHVIAPLIENRLPLRTLFSGPETPARILYHGLWFKGHNNPRAAELLPRLERLDPVLIVVSDRRPLRGVQYRALYALRPLRNRLALGIASRRYRYLLTADNRQIRSFRGTVVADVDDPTFEPWEIDALNRPNLAAYVVTAERAARRFEELGVRARWHVIPQGVALGALTERARQEVAARHRRDGEFVVGYTAAYLRTRDDPGGSSPLYNVDHLLELWPAIAERVPHARLWLLGEPSARIRSRVAAREDVLLLGRVGKSEVLSYAANFDVALYPRTQDQGIRAAKTAEYLGAGAPVVSYDYEVTQEVREAGAGILVSSPAEFVAAVAALAEDEARRAALAAAARAAGAKLDWDTLARRYADEVLDRYLPPAGGTGPRSAVS